VAILHLGFAKTTVGRNRTRARARAFIVTPTYCDSLTLTLRQKYT
jgi:hypothetical protein